MSIHQFLLALSARKKLFFFIVFTTVLLAAVASFFVPRTYVAKSSVLVDKNQEPLGFIETQVDIIRSSKVARRVIDELKLAQSPAAKADFEHDAGGVGAIEDWVADEVLRKLKVDWSQSSVIDIKYYSPDPKLSAAVANAFARGYVSTIQDLAVEPTRESLAWFEDQLKQLRNNLGDAQGKLTAYQRDKGITSTDERYDIETARLAELSTQLLSAQNQVQEATIRQQQARSFLASGASAENMPEIAGNVFIQSLKTQLLTGEARLQQMRSELGPNHPQLKAQVSELQSLRERLEAETAKVVAGMGTTARQVREREAELRNTLAAQRARVLQVKQGRNDLELMQREIETARQAYTNAYERAMVNRAQTRARQPQVAVLNQAVEPVLPNSPKVGLNIALSLAVGLMLAMALVYLLEANDRRVRSRLEFEAHVPVPMLGELHRFRLTDERGRLIDARQARLLPGPA